MALKVGPGDEVITTPFTFIATSEAIMLTGATPVFADIDPETFNINPAQIDRLITPAHQGHLARASVRPAPPRMDVIRAIATHHGIAVIEDSAQAMGATYQGQKIGSLGDFGCFSFFPSKNLGAFGDGGMITTNRDDWADRLRMLRAHGSSARYYHIENGLNSRLDELQAAILRVKLPHLDRFNQRRQQIAARYAEGLAPLTEYLTTPITPEAATHVFHQYTIRLKSPTAEARDALQIALRDAGVGSMIYYPVPLYRQAAYAGLELDATDYPVCEQLTAQVLSLPVFPELTDDEQQTVIDRLLTLVPQVMAQSANTVSCA